MKKTLILLALAMSLVAAGAAHALQPLRENAYVNERLVAAQVGDIIRKTCPTIGARLLYAISQADKLEAWALKQGYSRDEIRAFIRDPGEKRRVRAEAEAYMAAHGVVVGDVESYCALGRAEIERGTITGSLLFVK